MEKQFLDIQEAANILGVTKGTLYVWISQGRVPYYKIGKHVRFAESDLAEYMETKRIEARK